MKYVFLFVFLGLSACVGMNSGEKEPPKITEKTELKEALTYAIEFGGQTLNDVNKLIRHRKQSQQAEEILFNILYKDHDKLPVTSLINSMELFRNTASKRYSTIFKIFVREKSLAKRQLAWQLAADEASSEMSKEIDNFLTEAIVDNELKEVFLPPMADALANNRLITSYSVVREGLFHTNDIAFARSMIALNPRRASEDFLEYLTRAPIEELRQMSLKSVDVYTCTLILEHYRSYPPQPSNPHIETLFYYAISRNNAFSEMARDILERYLPKQSEAFAFRLSRLPSWMQIAFIEKSARRLTPVISLFLTELRKVTLDKDVADEISELKL